ncbi:hypothetical protein BT96DRAFT_935793 [Gymnopus androsaceus JB14]|uniref:Uncharacterized protein n=1 Tax=Gymnopus androsaceus JB14 TaxID=1447944 RepID=A0A6A4I116_9AGAR|nr:hypothetical protein BT96DRAFT_935793 [Gymnopus androsaceus JB14]
MLLPLKLKHFCKFLSSLSYSIQYKYDIPGRRDELHSAENNCQSPIIIMQIQLSLPLLLKPWTVNAMPTLKEECSEGALLSVFMVKYYTITIWSRVALLKCLATPIVDPLRNAMQIHTSTVLYVPVSTNCHLYSNVCLIKQMRGVVKDTGLEQDQPEGGLRGALQALKLLDVLLMPIFKILSVLESSE